MNKTFEYTFSVLRKKEGTDGRNQSDWYYEDITLRKKITDRMEERDSWKPVVAADYFTKVMRSEYGQIKCAHTRQIKEIK